MKQSTLAIIGAPLDLGSDRRGVDMGPSALRMAGLNRRLAALGYEVEDVGNVAVEQQESLPEGPRHAKYLPQIAAVCERIGDAVTQAAAEGRAPLVLGGDHSIAVGTVSGMAKFLRKKRQKMGIIWIDAHADMNTPQSSPSGNVHGMSLACLIGLGPPELAKMYGFVPKVDPRNVALVGLRNVDILERPQVRESGVSVFTMRDIDEKGMRWVIEQAIETASRGTVGYHLSLDMDFVDPQYAPGVGTPVPGGATYREAHLAMEMMADSGGILSMEVVEVNPVMDEVNRTADLAVELVLSALGKKILG
ncbi:MAG TPA: arginase [Solibacterales bacterium]|nr:arginase [Bryobacterales bacterium]